MPTPTPKFPILWLLMSVCLTPGSAWAQDSKASKPSADTPVGIWRGESLCATAAPSCHDEKVVFYIDPIADQPDSMFIRADKIVEGKAITMGAGPWKYDRIKHTLVMESDQRVWLLTINGQRIEGTLTLPDKVVFRRVTVTKGN